ncbi:MULTISPECIES: hypothetical protein [Planktothricoides]|uniref:Uncharacterized protein n=1 Tax=Planktothricoides raciborskii GIHE-MW2 TaxID=2792601 RepID=A0AAU8JM10_9CYAN|nr:MULTISPECIES: hypothetical protein [Planktothricoides]
MIQTFILSQERLATDWQRMGLGNGLATDGAWQRIGGYFIFG